MITTILKRTLAIFLFPLLFNSNVILPQNNSPEIKQALEYFGEANNLSELDNNYADQKESGNIKSPDWVLELKKGWSLKPAERKGSYILSKIN